MDTAWLLSCLAALALCSADVALICAPPLTAGFLVTPEKGHFASLDMVFSMGVGELLSVLDIDRTVTFPEGF